MIAKKEVLTFDNACDHTTISRRLFVTEAAANLHYGTIAKKSLKTFREKERGRYHRLYH